MSKPPQKPAPDYAQLEDRVMLSASPAADVMAGDQDAADADTSSTTAPQFDALTHAAAEGTAGDAAEAGQFSEQFRFESRTDSQQQLRHELVLIDTAAGDYQQLVADLMGQQSDTRQFEVFLLDAERDGIEQISGILPRNDDLDAIHIVSHGIDGSVKLGGGWLSLDNVGSYAGQLVGWRDALSANADLLFYGCDLASNEDGRTLVESLSRLTDSDVAASTDDTGHAIFGGDWELEYKVGQIETGVAFSQSLQQNWGHLLNVTVDATSTGTTTGLSATISHTTASASHRLMLVGVTIRPNSSETVSSVTYNGTGLSFVGARNAPTGARVEIWSLVAPDVGTHDVIVNLSSSGHGGVTVGVMTFNGADQTTPLGAFASGAGDGSSGSAVVSSATGELVFAAVAVKDTNQDLIPGAGQTERWDLFTGSEANGGGSTEAGAASVSMSWTWSASTDWAIGGVSIKANTDPIISLPGGAVNYTENDAATIIGNGATASDPDSSDFDTGTLTVDFAANGTANDRLAIRDQGTAVGQVGVSGSNVTYNFGAGAVTIGTFTGGSSGSDPLVVTFNANSDATSAQAVMRNVTYRNIVDNPSTASRTVRFVLTDGDGGTSNNVTETINVAAINDAPVVGAPVGPLAATEQTPLAIHGTGFTVSDADEAGAGATASLSVTEGTITVVEGDSGVTITGGNGTGTVSLSGTIAQLDNLLTGAGTGTVTYLNSSETPSASATLAVTVNDQGNAGTDPGTSGGPADEEDTNNVAINITAMNDAPVIGAPGAPLAATENIGLPVHGTGFTVSDVDEAGAGAAATLSVTEGTVTVVEGDSGVTITGGNGTGSVTLNGTIAQIDNLLTAAGTGTITYDTNDAPNASATFTVTVNDSGNTGADPGTSGGPADEEGTNIVTINITAVNDAPTITNLAGDSLAYTEGDGAALIEQGGDEITADVDSTNFDTGNLTVSLFAGSDPAEDVLSTRNQGMLAGQIGFSAGSVYYGGVLIGTAAGGSGGVDLIVALNANATPTAVTALVQNTTFEDTDTAAPTLGARTVRFAVNDGDGDMSLTHDATVTVSAANDPSVLAAIEGVPLAYIENDPATAITGTISVGDVDDTNIESATIQITGNYAGGQDVLAFTDIGPITGSWNAISGTMMLTGSDTLANYQAALRTVTYQNTSDNPSTLTRTVSFTVNDGDDPSNTVTRDINVTAVNDPSVLAAMEGTPLIYTENDPATAITETINVNDVDDTNIENATIQITGNYLSGQDVLAFIDTASITGSWNAVTGTITLTGTDSLANYETALRSVTYQNTSDDPSTLLRTVSFTANDGDDPSNTVTRDISVSATNDDPVITSGGGGATAGLSVPENTTAVTTVTSTDVDGGVPVYGIGGGADAALFSIGSSTGILTFNVAHDFESPVDADANNVYEVTVQVSDGSGGNDTQSISVTVTDVNEAPTASPATFAVNENAANGTSVATVSANDVDAGQSLMYSIVGGSGSTAFAINGSTGEITVADSSQLDYETATSFAVDVQVTDDGAPPLSDTATITISLNPLNDNLPVGTADSMTVAEGASVAVLDSSAASVLDNDSDADVPADTLTAVLDSGPSFAASFTLNADGTFLYVHDSSENFSDSFTYRVFDGSNTSPSVTVTINILPVNDAPVATGDAYAMYEDGTLFVPAVTGVLANDMDAEGDTLSASLVSGPTSGTLSLGVDGSFTYTPNKNYSGSDAFTYQIEDGNGGTDTATVTITIQAVVGPPAPDDGDPPPSVEDDSPPDNEPPDESTDPPLTDPLPNFHPPSPKPRRNAASHGLEAIDELVAGPAISQELFEIGQFMFFDTTDNHVTDGVRQALLVATKARKQLVAYIDPQLFWGKLDEFQEGLGRDDRTLRLAAGGVAMASLAVTAGYAFWTIKGGYLVASVLSTLPAWRFIDPLPIYDAVAEGSIQGRTDDDDDDDEEEEGWNDECGMTNDE